MGRLVVPFRQKVVIILSILLSVVAVGVQAQNEALISPEESETLLEKITGKEREIDWAHMNVQFATSANVEFLNKEFSEAAFKVNRVRLEVLGSFSKKFSYHFRQILNVHSTPGYSLDNLSGSVELANVGWTLSDRLQLTAGKQAVQFSGYECWVNAIKVRYYSDFNNYLPCYQVGVNLAYKASPNHELNFQIVNNRNGSNDELFSYGLPAGVEESKVPLLGTVSWDGYFIDRAMQLRYSLSYGQLARNRNVFYFTCGNVWDKKPFLGYIDFMYSREGLDSKGLISQLTAADGNEGCTVRNVEYFTTIGNLDYRISPHWNLYVKGVYELGNVFRSSDGIQSGNYRRTWNAQLCAEFFPMEESGLLLYLHLLYKHTHLTELARRWGAEGFTEQRISLGLVYTLPVF